MRADNDPNLQQIFHEQVVLFASFTKAYRGGYEPSDPQEMGLKFAHVVQSTKCAFKTFRMA